MTPSVSLLVYVALFWTLPATIAVIAYRRYGSSFSKLRTSLQRSLEPTIQPPRPEKAKATVDA